MRFRVSWLYFDGPGFSVRLPYDFIDVRLPYDFIDVQLTLTLGHAGEYLLCELWNRSK